VPEETNGDIFDKRSSSFVHHEHKKDPFLSSSVKRSPPCEDLENKFQSLKTVQKKLKEDSTPCFASSLKSKRKGIFLENFSLTLSFNFNNT